MRFPMNTYKDEGTSWGKLNVMASLIWVSFFQYNLLDRMLRNYSNTTLSQSHDTSLLGLAWYTSLGINISHLSITGGVTHGKCYICFLFLFPFIFCLYLLFFSVFILVVFFFWCFQHFRLLFLVHRSLK